MIGGLSTRSAENGTVAQVTAGVVLQESGESVGHRAPWTTAVPACAHLVVEGSIWSAV
jgi:hypothetical protein